ncbi:ankyrin repeat-containing domain protein [Scleroderma citrinum]
MPQEYLISKAICAELQEFYISPPEAHLQVALLSVTYILHDEALHRLTSLSFRHRLLYYCVTSGLQHIEYAAHYNEGRLLHLIEMLHQQIKDQPGKFEEISRKLWERQLFRKLLLTPDHVLFIVVCFGSLKLVQYYLDRYPDVINGEGIGNPLKYVIDANRLDVAQELLKRGQDPMWPAVIVGRTGTPRSEAFDAMAFMLSRDWYAPEAFELICSCMPTVSPGIIHRLANQQCHPSLVRCLLERGANAASTDDCGTSTLFHCLNTVDRLSDAIYLDITQLLVDSGCPMDAPDFRGRTPLHIAARREITPVVRYLLEKGCQIPEDIIHHVRGAPCFHLLIQRGANVRAVTRSGDTALHALFCRNWPGPTNGLEIAKALVTAGCDVNLTRVHPPVIYAASCDIPTAQYILDSGATVTKDIISATLRYIVSWESDPRPPTPGLPSSFEMVTLFTRQNAHRLPPNVYAFDGFGRTPLHMLLLIAQPQLFSAQELVELVRSFVDSGCDFLLPTATGETPLRLALKLRHGELVSYLVSMDANFSDVKDLAHLPLKWAVHLPWYQRAIATVPEGESSMAGVSSNEYMMGYDTC